MNIIKTLAAVVALIVMSGCATVSDVTGADPYVDVGIGHQIDSNSDWYLRTDRPYQCNNPQAFMSVGLEWNKTTLEYAHQSWFFCGKPFNHKSELYTDSIILKHRFGGRH